MFEIENKTPFDANGAVLQDKNGDKFWIVAVKATHEILEDGTLKIAEEQKEVSTEPVYRGKPEETSLLYDTDIVLSKKTTDVILNGSAYGQQGKKRNSVKVNLRVADINKTLLVKGSQKWSFLLLKGLMKPFSKMPITYENTWGGTDFKDKRKRYYKKNPVGSGFCIWPWRLIGKKVPNVLSSNFLLRVTGNRSVGFGAIAPHWNPRTKYGGTYDKKWEEIKKPLLADDFNELFYQSAPKDQQTKSFLKGSETVELTNLTIEGKLKFQLPEIGLNFTTYFNNDEEESIPKLHSLIIEPDERSVSTVWHTSVPCQNRDEILRKTQITLSEDYV
ncbi:MAG: DUF2169 domain-containing protein [Deltaproteobacteria bacterium]|nr:DUF2169 domain-containing protein [Deltaproteobacteria bacterium]